MELYFKLTPTTLKAWGGMWALIGKECQRQKIAVERFLFTHLHRKFAYRLKNVTVIWGDDIKRPSNKVERTAAKVRRQGLARLAK